ncbi:hypothetical protein NFI96_031539, partial [Prochilodus magdalenae]
MAESAEPGAGSRCWSRTAGEVARVWSHLARTLVLVFPVYALGYLELSACWLLLGLALLFMWRRRRRAHRSEGLPQREAESCEMPAWAPALVHSIVSALIPTPVSSLGPALAPAPAPALAPSVVPALAPAVASALAPSVVTVLAPGLAPALASVLAHSVVSTLIPTPAAPALASALAPALASALAPALASALAPALASVLAPALAFALSPSLTFALAPSLTFALAPSLTFALAPSLTFALAPSLTFALAPSLTFALAPALVFALAPSLTFALAPALVFALAPSLVFALAPALAFALAPSLTFALAPALAFALAPALVFALAPSLTFALAPSLTFALAPALVFALAPSLVFALAPALTFALAPALAFALAPALAYALAPALAFAVPFSSSSSGSCTCSQCQRTENTLIASQVHFPDVERVEWLNKTVQQMWPYVCQFVEKVFRETIEPAVKGVSSHLSTFTFTKIDLGDKPLRVNGVKVYTENVDKRQIIMDLQISFVANTEIEVDIKRYYCKAGIKSIQLHGVLRVVLEPLLSEMPLVGAFSLFFLKKPLVDISWTGLTNVLDIPGLKPNRSEKVPHRPKLSEKFPHRAKLSEKVPHRPKLSEKVPHRPNLSEKIPHRPNLSEKVPHTPNLSEKVPHRPNLSEKVPHRAKLSEKVPHRPKLSEKVPHRANLSEKIPHRANLSEKIPHRSNLSEKIPHRPNLSEKVPHRPKLSEKVPHRPNLSEKVPHRPNLSEKVPHRANLSEKIPHRANLSEKVPHRPNLSEKVPHRPKLSEKVPHRPNLSEKVPHRPNLSEKVPHRPNLSEKVPHIPNLTEKIPHIPNLSEKVPHIPNLTEKIPHIPNLTEKIPHIPNFSENVPHTPNLSEKVPHRPNLSESGFSDNLIQEIIYNYLVLPNRITIPLVGDVELSQLRFPMPKGVLRIHFLEAQNLEGKDKFLGGLIKGKSDPYGVLHVANQLFQSKTIKECLNPKWSEVFEAMVYEHSGQHLEVELFDEDPDKDDFLGSLMIDLTELHKEQKVDEWFDLEEVSSGKLHLRLEWLSLHSDAEKLDQALRSMRSNDSLSSALLVVHLDSARNLPSGRKVNSDPSPYVQLTVGQKTYESKVSLCVWTETTPLSFCSQILCLEKEVASGRPSSVQIRRTSQCVSATARPQSSTTNSTSTTTQSNSVHAHTRTPPLVAPHSTPQGQRGSEGSPVRLAQAGRSTSSSAISMTRQQQNHRDSMHSLASDTSLPSATLELQHRLTQLQNGSAPAQHPLGEVQLTIRHSSQRNKLIVVVHACRNLIALGKDASDPYIRLYLLPDKSRSGRRKTSTMRKTLNPVYDQ